MIVLCATCGTCFDDVYRWTFCPHDTFAANDGHNHFAHHPESLRHPVVLHGREAVLTEQQLRQVGTTTTPGSATPAVAVRLSVDPPVVTIREKKS